MNAKQKRCQIEKEMLDELENFLSLAGIRVRRQVYCGYMGFADLVTDCCVYEAKVRLTSNTLKAGVGQVTIYRNYIDRSLSRVVLGKVTKYAGEAIPYIADEGISVLGWRPMQDWIFTTNLALLEGIEAPRYKELMDEFVWKMENDGIRPIWSSINEDIICGISAIEHPENSPLIVSAKGDERKALLQRIAFRESREDRPIEAPSPLAGLPAKRQVRDDAY